MKITLAQIKLTNSINQNLKKIINYIKLADKKKSELMCFPECALTGYTRNFNNLNFPVIEEKIRVLKVLGQKKKINIIIGLPYLKKKKLFNSALVLLKNGQELVYHKQNLTPFDKKYFSAGNKNLIFRIKNNKYGLAICRDQNLAKIFENYKKQRVKFIFILSAHYYSPKEARLKVNKNKALPIVRALDNKVYLAKVNAVGKVKKKISLGGSLIVNPQGYILKEASQRKEEILSFSL